jgi:type I restriction enzyme M protein
MRKSLGEKRKEISPDQIAEITRLYGEFQENDRVKILPNESFGYLRITVERPLRVRWEVSDETLAALGRSPKLVVLQPEILDRLVAGLSKHRGLESYDRTRLASTVDPLVVELSRAQRQEVWEALAVRDPLAPVITNRRGDPEPDSELREGENVPLPAPSVRYEPDPSGRLATLDYLRAVDEYLDSEILSWTPDCWADHTKTRIGYEVPLTRHFYRFKLLRPLKEIDEEIKFLEVEIQGLLRRFTG